MSKINRRPLRVNDCVHMAMNTQNIYLRTYWMNQAKAMLDAVLPVVYDGTQGLTMEVGGGGLYRRYATTARHERFERVYKNGVSL